MLLTILLKREKKREMGLPWGKRAIEQFSVSVSLLSTCFLRCRSESLAGPQRNTLAPFTQAVQCEPVALHCLSECRGAMRRQHR